MAHNLLEKSWLSLVGRPALVNRPWRMLVVNDNPLVHEALRFALAGSEILGQSLELMHADSLPEAQGMMTGQTGWIRLPGHGDSSGLIYLEADRRLLDEQLNLSELFSGLLGAAMRTVQLLGRVRSLAYFDQLCRLPNRPMFINLLDEALQERRDWVVAITDIDYFSSVTNALGYRLGDGLLRAVAQRLESSLGRRGYQLARINTDNFAILAPADEFDIHQILSLFVKPLTVEDYQLPVSMTAGMVYVGDVPESTGEAVLKCAATALKMAKHQARGSFRCFAPNMALEVEERVQLLHDLKATLAQRGLDVHYQPQVSLADGCPVGVEALVRWRHPVWGMVAPDRFIGIAERTGLIVDLGEFVLERACRDQVAWRQRGLPPLRVAVNVSMTQFRSPRFLPAIRRVLAETGIRPVDLELEITESMVMNDVQIVISTLQAIKALGVTVAIDDFGTGFSSLAHLHTLPIDRLKVDRSFVHDIDEGNPGGKIAEMIVSLGHTLGKCIIAEGIEQAATAEVLRGWGCQEGQGYLYARPMPGNELANWLQEQQ